MSVENVQTFRINPKLDSSFDFVVKQQSTETENFTDEKAANTEYSKRLDALKKDIRYQEIKQGLVVLGGLIGGIGVGAISRSNGLSLDSPNTYIGVDMLLGGIYLAQSGLAAVNKEAELRTLYKETQKRWDHIKARVDKRKQVVRDIYKSKEVVIAPQALEEEVVSFPQGNPVSIEQEAEVYNPDQPQSEQIHTDPLENPTKKRVLSKRIKEAMGNFVEILERVEEGQLSPLKTEAKGKSLTSESIVNAQAVDEKPLPLGDESARNTDEDNEQNAGTDPNEGKEEVKSHSKDKVKDLIKHYRWRDKVIKNERKFLKEMGIIPEHKCYKKDCGICAGYDPIFF